MQLLFKWPSFWATVCKTVCPMLRDYCPCPVCNAGLLWPNDTAASTVSSRNTLSEIVFGCLNIRSLLNKYDDVVKLCRDGQR